VLRDAVALVACIPIFVWEVTLQEVVEEKFKLDPWFKWHPNRMSRLLCIRQHVASGKFTDFPGKIDRGYLTGVRPAIDEGVPQWHRTFLKDSLKELPTSTTPSEFQTRQLS
jgi:hypothetical protein